MRTFQGTFHASPDYALWYGWSEMQRDLTDIKEMAAQIRRSGHAPAPVSVSPVKKATMAPDGVSEQPYK
jgi:hypothetical protein